MFHLPLGASTWCFNGFVSPELTAVLDGGAPLLPEHMGAVRAYFAELTAVILGSRISTVELWYSEALWDEEVARSLDRLGAGGRIASAHAPFGLLRNLSSPNEDVRTAGLAGCRAAARLLARCKGHTLVLHGGSAVVDPSEMPERVRESAESIAEIADFCRDLGLQVAVELVAAPAVGSSAPELLTLLELIGRPNVGVCLDVNHVFPAERLIPAIYSLGERILALHVADYDGREEKHWLPASGVIDWAAVVRALREVRYRGPFLYEARFAASGVREAASVIEENYRSTVEPGQDW